MLQLQSPSIPGTYSTKIWMSTELAENRNLGPLGHPHHRGVLSFCRHFITNLKIAQGLRAFHTHTMQFSGRCTLLYAYLLSGVYL